MEKSTVNQRSSINEITHWLYSSGHSSELVIDPYLNQILIIKFPYLRYNVEFDATETTLDEFISRFYLNHYYALCRKLEALCMLSEENDMDSPKIIKCKNEVALARIKTLLI
jgi:hypothetical protein